MTAAKQALVFEPSNHDFDIEVLMRHHLTSLWFTIFLCVLAQDCLVSQCQGQFSSQPIQLLKSDTEAMSARLALIDTAARSIEISTYHIESGTSTTAILDALRSAARRGVAVRLLLDGLNMDLSANEIDSLRNVGIEIREFHSVGSGGLRQLNRRSHSKLFAVDGEFLILGSRNMRDKHFGLENDRYVDIELLLKGNLAASAVDYFDWIWNSCHVGNVKVKAKRNDQRDGTHEGVAVCCRVPFKFEPQFDAFSCCLFDGNINKDEKRMRDQRIQWVNSARHSLMIETPYPAFSRASLKAIEAAAKRGVRVQIFTNSKSSNDQPLTWAALQNVRRRLLRLGVEIYEYQGEDTMHAKMFLVDGRFAVLGSHNFDARSDNFNLEFCVKADSVELTQHLEDRLRCRRLQSHRLTDPKPTRNQPLTERVKTRVRQLTALLIRPLL